LKSAASSVANPGIMAIRPFKSELLIIAVLPCAGSTPGVLF
jgi:hypothetical protein